MSDITGGAHKKRTTHAKKGKKKIGTKKHKRGGAGGPTLEDLQHEARKLGIPLSKDGKKKTKASLTRAIARHK